MRKFPLIVLCLFLSAGMGHAQTQNNGSLTGLKQITFTMGSPDNAPNKAALACGITPALIRDAAMYPLSATRLKILEETPSQQSASTLLDVPIFDLTSGTVRDTSGLCFSTIHLEVIIMQWSQASFASVPRWHHVVLWENGWFGYSATPQHAKQIRDEIEVLTKKFVTEWNSDNKPQ